MTAMTRTLGRSGLEVSALGMGCWAIGGPFWAGDQPCGWGEVDDDEFPGCRTVAQVEENAGAMAHGPLTPAELAEVERLLADLRAEPVAAM